MLQRVLPALILCSLSLPAWSQATAETAPQTATAAPEPVGAAPAAVTEIVEEAPQTVLVSGARPGPGLWKVSKGDHMMWVFGVYTPLPEKMEWRSRNVEKAIAGSQEYLKPPLAQIGVGWGAITALPFLIGVKKNPDGAELKDLLPPDVYARWQPLKQKYFGNDSGIERERPSFVAFELSNRALKEAGLTRGTEVEKTIEGLVKKHKLKVSDPTVEIKIKDPGKAVRDFKKSAMDDVPCLAKTMERLESELGATRELANAWATGEIENIRKLNYGDRAACKQAVLSSSLAKNQPELHTLTQQASDSWLAAAEKALAANTSTFAMVHIKDILDPKGIIATLQAKGYTVEAPK
ncbi:TraB/GumN family protein [Massilia sp. Dwa41.01b]|uniref:TraB/GumN family protein n=1 Tax=unclassified Massilia TaxID=2609279 RepID=UPI0016019C74|nr:MULTISPECIES: TraB/GumN family protein [unclassified Massilia]QNA90647.1 TraB/GumN family protein [Massilia sp. Dwa41.01b]QNA97877.1 TraB/GumN family protein [Massilia sp. Se16.2.3]